MWPQTSRQQAVSREISNRLQQYGGQSTSWLSDLPLQLIDRLNDLNDNGDYSPNATLYGQQRDYLSSDLQDYTSGRGSGYDSEMHYHNQQAGHESPYLSYDSTFYSQRSKEFLPIDRRSRSNNRLNVANPYTPTSVIDQSGFSVTPSPSNGECSRENSPPPPSSLAPCRQLPCRYFTKASYCKLKCHVVHFITSDKYWSSNNITVTFQFLFSELSSAREAVHTMTAVYFSTTLVCSLIVSQWRRGWGRVRRTSVRTHSSGQPCQEEKSLGDWTVATVSYSAFKTLWCDLFYCVLRW